ncbi:MAG: DNA repair protein RecO [Planctomycetota bacterium]
MAGVSDEAVCLRQWDWSETSQTVLLFARDYGLVRAIAKGSRRPKSAFSGGLEAMTRGGIELIPKREGALATLTSWDLLEPYASLRRRLPVMHAGLYACDLVAHAVSVGDRHELLYDALLELLEAHAELGEMRDDAMLVFHRTLLAEIGLTPRLDEPPEPDARVWRFDPERGELVGSDRARQPPTSESWPIRAETVEALVEGPAAAREASTLSRANRFCAAFLARKLDADLPVARLVFGPVVRRR